MEGGHQAGVSVGTEHASCRSSSALYSMVTALSAAITDEEKRCMELLFSHLSEANRIMR